MSFENLRAAAELSRLQRRVREAQLAECGAADFRTLEVGCEAAHAAAHLSADVAAVARDPMSNEAVRVSGARVRARSAPPPPPLPTTTTISPAPAAAAAAGARRRRRRRRRLQTPALLAA